MVTLSTVCALYTLGFTYVLAQASDYYPYVLQHSHYDHENEAKYNEILLENDFQDEELTFWTTIQEYTTVTPSTTHTELTTAFSTPDHVTSVTPPAPLTVYATEFLTTTATVTHVYTPDAKTVTSFIYHTPNPKHIFSAESIGSTDRPLSRSAVKAVTIARPSNAPPIAKAKAPIIVTTTIIAGGPINFERKNEAVNADLNSPIPNAIKAKTFKPKQFRVLPLKLDADSQGYCSDQDTVDYSNDTCDYEDVEDTATFNCTPTTIVEDDVPDCTPTMPDCAPTTSDCGCSFTTQVMRVPAPTCGCNDAVQDYEHQYGDDTMDFVLDTKDHLRERFGEAKERAKSALSHVRPAHIHDRIDQVVHDERPIVSDEHLALHNHYSGKSRKPNHGTSHSHGGGRKHANVPKRSRKTAVQHDTCGSCGTPIKAAAPCGCDVNLDDITPDCGSDYEHQYGDDTMDYILNTKDHARGWWNSVKERTKKMLSHAAPKHIHDRVSQVLHDKRPDISDEHAELHANKGRRASRRG